MPHSSKTNFIRTLPVKGTHHPSQNNTVRFRIKASRAEGPRHLHTNTACAHLWGLNWPFCGTLSAKNRQHSAEKPAEGLRCSGFRGFAVWVWGLGFRSIGFRVQVFGSLGFRVSGFRSSGFRVQVCGVWGFFDESGGDPRLYVCQAPCPFWVHFGSILGPFWVHSGSILGIHFRSPFWESEW